MTSPDRIEVPPQPRRFTAARVGAAATLTLVLILYLVLQGKNFVPAYSEPDLDAYLWLTKRIATLQPLAVPSNSPFQFHDHMWVTTPGGLVTTKFAPGSALLMAPFYLLFGDIGPFLLPPLAGTLTLVAAYLLFRRWMGRTASFLALLTIALNPLFLIYTNYILTHAADICLVTWGMLFLFRYLEAPKISFAIGAGLTLGFVITVRYVNVLLALPLIAVFVMTWLRTRGRPHLAALFLIGSYALFPLALMAYNYALFANPFRTGYSLSREQSAFTLDMLTFNYANYLDAAFRTFLFVALPLGGLGALILGPWDQRVARLLWIVPLLLAYMAYYWFSPHPVSYRFILALLPVFVGCAYAFIDHSRANRWARYAALLLLTIITVVHDGRALRMAWEGRSHVGTTASLTAGNFLASKLQPDAVLFTDSRFAHYVSQRKRFELYDLAAFRRSYLRHFPEDRPYTLDQAAKGMVPPRMQPSRLEFIRNFYKAQSDKALDQLQREIIEQSLANHRQVAVFVPASSASSEIAVLAKRWKVEPRAKIDIDWTSPAADRPGPKETWQLLEILPLIAQPAPPHMMQPSPTD